MIVLVDTDVLLDVALGRAPHAAAAATLLDELEANPGSGFVAWHTIANFYYLCSSRSARPAAKEFIKDLASFVSVAPTTTQDLLYAIQLPLKDFEDALQVAAAVACGADVIATRNTRDFARSSVTALSPAVLMKKWQ